MQTQVQLPAVDRDGEVSKTLLTLLMEDGSEIRDSPVEVGSMSH